VFSIEFEPHGTWWSLSVALTKVVCITMLTGNRLGQTVRCGRPPLLLPSCKKLEFKTVSVDGLGSGMGKW